MAQYNLENRGPDLVVITTIFLALSWIAVCLRTCVRIFITKAFAVDDWLMITTILNFTLTASFIYVSAHFGLGRHNASLSPENEIKAMKYSILALILYLSSMAFVKLSIGFFLLRIAVQKRYIYTLRITMVAIALGTIGIFLFAIFQCHPVEAQWDSTLPGGTCVPEPYFVQAAYAFTILAILSDWLCALLPVPMIWRIKMSVQAKIVVTGIFMIGIFASVATLIRVKYLVGLNDIDDILYSGVDALAWSVIEISLSIIAASMATLRPLLRALKIIGFGS